MAQEILAAGKAVMIRTVTMAHVGRVVSIDAEFILLEDGGWIAETGRFSQMLNEGQISEFERAPGQFLVAKGGLIDVWPWDHDLPKKTI
jgi:hypothetical protein